MKRNVCLLLSPLLLLVASTALAGGWAVVTLDQPPGEIRADKPWSVGFTVLQHGVSPVHELDPTSPIEPLIVAEHPSGRRLEVQATPTKKPGHFVAELTFPIDGSWTWTIYPNPLAGETLFEPLTVMPAAAAVEQPAAESAAPVTQPVVMEAAQPIASPAVEEAGLALPGLLRWAAVGAALLALALFVIDRRRPAAVRS
jgi:hypothetical protein